MTRKWPHAHSLRYQASWAGECRLLVTEGWGHRRILAAPQVSQAISSFLQGHRSHSIIT